MANRFLLIVIALCLLLRAMPASGTVLDWSDVAWTPGSLTQTYNLDGDDFDDITITISGLRRLAIRNRGLVDGRLHTGVGRRGVRGVRAGGEDQDDG